ncbi:hypothetical protein Sme01_14180 [Sphaerisporangium melleum]|uniref:Uncharacterized protein n=1 Tax=Sphaerisporangium melleum TaxID=321316 RepID=A0A917VFA3_9ACTN|nr:hypothetical protein [Sphaerisporangium melleum]GGK68865.1 hypothetical protein GCM10007964_09780 [Sphaerisporangium melleum]GII68942.1 hypothetical protein Sme01_14180 [Sphaerisporangium melleum]
MTEFAAHVAAAAQGAAAAAAPIGPGLIGFLVVAAIGLALYFLVKSMNKQISKIQVPHEAELRKAEREKAGHAGSTSAAAPDTSSEPRADGSR